MRVAIEYPHDAASVYRFVTDPDRVVERCAVFGERDVKVTVDGGTVSCNRVVDAEVPGFVKRIIRPSNLVTDVKRWDPATRTATFTVDVRGVPVTVAGTVAIRPALVGCVVEVTFTVTASVPIVGGMLQRHVEGLTAAGIRREHEWNRARLGPVRPVVAPAGTPSA